MVPAPLPQTPFPNGPNGKTADETPSTRNARALGSSALERQKDDTHTNRGKEEERSAGRVILARSGTNEVCWSVSRSRPALCDCSSS